MKNYLFILMALLMLYDCGDNAAYKKEKLCTEIVDNDTISKQYYFRFMDLWIKRFTPDCSTADEDSLQVCLEKMRVTRDERMEGFDSAVKKELYWYYLDKQEDWQIEWSDMNGWTSGALPLIAY